MKSYFPLSILMYPNTLLVARNRPLDAYTPEIEGKVREMFALMYRHQGVGLAAPQVGWNVQLFILNLSGKESMKSQEQVIFNPIMTTNGCLEGHLEGCLSFPKMNATIERSTVCRIVGRSPAGIIDKEFSGFGAQAVQHEMDHLDGILFHERMSREDRIRNEPLLRAMVDRDNKRR